MDGTEDQKDTLQGTPGQSLTGEDQGTSKEDAKTYTEEDVKKQVNDALAAAGRNAKQLTDKEASLKAQEEAIKASKAEIDEFQSKRDQAELEAAKDDPYKMREYQRKQAQKQETATIESQRAELKKQQEELDRQKAEHEAEVKSARETQMDITLWQIAAAEKVNPVELKDTMKDLSLTTIEQAKALAKRLNKVAPKQPAEGDTEPGEEKPFTPDSGVTSGAKGELTPEQFEKLSMSEKAKYLDKK